MAASPPAKFVEPTLVTSTPGSHLQGEGGLKRAGDDARVVHLAELVDRALEAR